MHQTIELVKIIKLINGDDIVCVLPKEQLEEASPLVRLEKPLQIKYISQLTARGLRDYVALIKWTGYTNDHIVTIPKDKILTITSATDEMSKSYLDVSKKYDMIENVHPAGTNFETKTESEKKPNDESLWDKFSTNKKTLH